ncbi:DUF885 domain-containing protein [Aliidiomarina taiwanensis]|uniref:DUF885 domain-containing protein n=1 Tax=Aliidiomarina taiwanensis TaxID=946228 RepID=A0A432X8B7_9GAMM|nr:DUF885 domain-containing protein [Aliidiomarina taiwanensis]RUO43655.1 DUF885 domain-containing protein [Aliidiomarina taiwanensis]
MRYFIGLAAGVLLSGCVATTSPPTADTDATFQSIAEAAWDFNRRQYPPTAVYLGDKSVEGKLTDISPEALEMRYNTRKRYYEQIEAIPAEQLSEANQINREMILYALRNQLSDYEYQMYLTPLTSETGPHNRLAYVANGKRLRNAHQANVYLSELSEIPGSMQQYIAYMREGIAAGITQPAVVLQGMPNNILALVPEDPTESVFYRPIAEAKNTLPAEVFQEVDSKARSLISERVHAAYLAFHDFMVNEYIPNSREDIAATNLPNGDAFYANRVRHYTTTDLSPEEIHNRGLAEVARIRAEMDAVIAEIGFEGTFEEFTHFLRTDPQFYPTSEEQLLKEAAYISKKADAALPQYFKLLPRNTYGVAPVPAEIAPTYTTGRYAGSSSPDQPGYYWVNTYALDRRPLYALEALTLHEAVPGHHLQISLAKEMENVPDYRRSTYISAFGEGWGLYAEHWGVEAGFYQDPYSNFGRLSYEMWRAARLVVDTGMHTMGWSRDRAVEFMASNTALSLHNVNTEIDRYISWPAQALSYKLGEMLIKQLRADAEAALGEHFDIREFHYQVLKNGSIPLATLERKVRGYIEEAAAAL